MSNLQAKLLLVVGVVCMGIGITLAVKTDLLGTMPRGLNGATENALIFLVIGIVCLFAGAGLRR